MERAGPIFRFGPYESRSQTRELYKHGAKLKIRPQPLQILNVLLSRAGDVVTREELRQQVWSSETFVDFEHSLNTSVKEIRAVLGDSAAEPQYIETLPRLGYRFIAPVEVIEPAVDAILSESQSAAPSSALHHSGDVVAVEQLALRRWSVLVGIAVGLILATLAAYFQWSRFRARPQPSSGRIMLAVLPFENLTGDAGQDYFSDGLTEEMIFQLSRLDPEHLGVIARTSVMHYKHSQEQIDRIGHELGVQYVLEGSVRRDSAKVRIAAQLIRVADQTHMWARQYDRELGHLLALQAEIALEIAAETDLTLGADKQIGHARQASLSPKAYEAYDLYLKGLYSLNKRHPKGFQQAIEYFEQATAEDPNYARAYAGLANSYALMSAYSLAPQREFMPKARAAALKALEIDDKLAEAHTSLAFIAENYDWDWQTAEKEFRRAIRLDPNYATAHHWFGECLALQGRFDEAFVEMEQARRLDPLSLIIAADNGAILYFSRQYDRAIEQLRAVLEKEPNFPRAHVLLYAYAQKEMFSDALADIEKWSRVDDTPGPLAALAYVYGRAGQQVEARRALQKLEQFSRRRERDAAPVFVAYIGMGNKDEALAWLQRAYSKHSPALTALKVDPLYDPLRGDPRFQELLRRVGLAP